MEQIVQCGCIPHQRVVVVNKILIFIFYLFFVWPNLVCEILLVSIVTPSKTVPMRHFQLIIETKCM